MPLGALESSTYQSVTTQLVPGDRLLFYTDGILDALSNDLGEQQRAWQDIIKRALARSTPNLPPAIIAELSSVWVSEHIPDDITLLCLEYLRSTSSCEQQLSYSTVLAQGN
jgi:serine phosphatase RsbU (regulator of sigma subunit)